MDTSQYLDIFLDETKEHLQNLNTQIMDLEQNPENMDTINEIFRAAHSLKGMAGTMGYKRMQTLTHDMENVFSEVRNGTFKVQPDMIDVLFRCLDALEEYVANIQKRQGLYISCIEEIAYIRGFISRMQLLKLAEKNAKTEYGKYLQRLANDEASMIRG